MAKKNATTTSKSTKPAGAKGDAARTEKARKAALAEIRARTEASADGPIHEGRVIRGDGKAARVTVPRDDVPATAAPADGTPQTPTPDAAPQAPTSGTPKAKGGRKPKEPKAGKPAKEPKVKKLSALDAAAQVLAASPTPMTAVQMIEQMAVQGLWESPGGKTPSSTLYAAVIREIAAKGTDARFKKVDRGMFQAAGK